ncbi:hypothetical protein [Solitalea koreensis]|uniref:Uncharacterized protein n=1 Tax=Solitalea koreensis TaxID=543615 RepID=A0A521DQ55_9SPHI|nr:hypothetical protein [Solitalea koreensis]SMO73758.1 hypothetical protein SAMN06265350_10848 [Solitalea koreensis]
MKKLLFTLIIVTILPMMAFKAKPAEDGYYAFIVIDGVWKDGRGYTSKIIYFPGYDDCNKYKAIDYFDNARRAFSNHLKAYHNDAFPYGENNNFKIIDKKQYSTSTLLQTYEQAQQRMTQWVAEQKEKGYEVTYTNFGFSCNSL